jgi:hypothetical protein
MLRWSTTGAAVVLRDLIVPALRDVLIPAGGLYGILTDRPLVPLAAGAYLVMMGLPVAGVVDRLRERKGDVSISTSTPADPTGTSPPSGPQPPVRPS